MADGVDLGIDGLGPGAEVGSGGFGTVYRATETDFGRTVAVKILQNLDDAGRRRFDRERLSMGRLHEHPNVVTPYRSGYTDRGWPFLVMEYLEGGSLADVVKREGPLPWARAAGYVIPVADALGHGHALGVLHRDVKPENILLTRTGVPKLTDFGIAVVQEGTATASIGYSLAHAPPETFAGGRDQRNERSDLYSLASTLYELVVGRGPFHIDDGVADSQLAYIVRIAQEPIPTLGLDPRYDQFLQRALAKDPNHRPANAAAFVDQLQATLGPAQGPVATPETVVAPAAGPLAAPPGAGANRPLTPPPAAPAPPPTAPAPASLGAAATPGPPPAAAAPAPPPGFAPPAPYGGGGGAIGPGPVDRRPTGGLVAALVAAVILIGAGLTYVVVRSGDDANQTSAADTNDGSALDQGEPTETTPPETETIPPQETETTPEAPDETNGDQAPAFVPIESELRIGGVLPETGVLSFLGPAMNAGAQLAIDDINAAGGVFGSDVAWLPGDSGDIGSDTAVATVERLLGQDVQAVVGAASSGTSLRVIDQIIEAGVIQISPANTSTQFTDYPDDGLYFRTAPSDIVQGAALADLLVADGNSTVAFLVIEDSYGTDLLEFTRVPLEAAGGDIVVERTYNPNQADFSAEVAAVVAADPDAIVIIGFFETAQILQGLIDVGFGPSERNVYGTDANIGGALAADLNDPSQAAGMRGTLPGIDALGELPAFVDRLDGLDSGIQLYAYAAESYDAVVVVALAAVAANSDNPRAIADHISDVTGGGTVCVEYAACVELLLAGEDIDYDGMSGPLEIGPEGDPYRAPIQVVQLDETGGTFVAEIILASIS